MEIKYRKQAKYCSQASGSIQPSQCSSELQQSGGLRKNAPESLPIKSPFFIGYILFEVPSNLYMQRVSIRKTFLRIMVVWGLLSMGMSFISTPTQFYVMRFLLGVAEAGFLPGVMLYLTYWFPSVRRGRVSSIGIGAGSLTGTALIGWIKQMTGSLYLGAAVIGATMIVGAILALTIPARLLVREKAPA